MTGAVGSESTLARIDEVLRLVLAAMHFLTHTDSHMSQIGQLTLRSLDPRVQREIRELARRERISLNKAALRLLEKGTGLGARQEDRIGRSLDHLIGTWTESAAKGFLDSIQSCEQVDPDLWD